MTLVEQLEKLQPSKVKEIRMVMEEAALISELRGHIPAKARFRRAKNNAIGIAKKIYALMETANPHQLEVMKDALMDYVA